MVLCAVSDTLLTPKQTSPSASDTPGPFLCAVVQVFDFDALKKFISRKDFSMKFDAMHAVTGPYAHRILVKVCDCVCVCVFAWSDLFCSVAHLWSTLSVA